jgi:flagellar motility protein MotE (MotC chaperone)
MAEYGEWNRKGATLSDVTAQKEYGVSRDLILRGINSGKLEYREGAVWGNPYLRILRSQLEKYIAAELGSPYLGSKKRQTELRAIKKEIADLKKRLDELQARRAELEGQTKEQGTNQGTPPEPPTFGNSSKKSARSGGKQSGL